MCNNPAKYRFTWPGNDESVICEDHVNTLINIAAAMSLHLQIILLSEKDLTLGLTCNQKGDS
jgi:hypothetical protein